jgi:hypothetical protein
MHHSEYLDLLEIDARLALENDILTTTDGEGGAIDVADGGTKDGGRASD